MAKSKQATKADQQRRETQYRTRVLDLPQSRLTMQVGRIGYPDEGLRLTIASGFPFDFHVEAQLSRTDALSLIEQLRAWLDDPNHDNMPRGTR